MNTQPDQDMPALAGVFRAAAAMLAGATAMDGPPQQLLARLGYLDGTAEQTPHRTALLRAAAGFRRIFTLAAVDAPGLVVLGGEVDPAGLGVPDAPLGSVAGTGLTFQRAFEACVGEGVEYLSQFAAPGDPIEPRAADDVLAEATSAVRALWQRLLPFRRDRGAALSDWTIAADLADGHPVPLPADLCFRRPAAARDLDLPWPLSTGCGAGPDPLTATLHGLLELIERDAVALWWRGGRRARLLPGDAGAAVLAQLRGGITTRRSWLLDISSDVGVPVVAAASCGEDGFGLCCGFASRPTLAGAAEAALREMAQMELAWRLTETKRAVRGEAALNDADRQHVRRFTTIDVANTPALQPLVPPRPPADLPVHDPRAMLAELRHRLEQAGLAPCVLDLTRAAFGIPVTRAVCPGLEPGMAAPPGPRLLAASAQTSIDPADFVPVL